MGSGQAEAENVPQLVQLDICQKPGNHNFSNFFPVENI